MLRKIPLQTEHYYHIYNRGVEKINIFKDKYDYIRFLRSMIGFNTIKPIGSLFLQDKLKEEKSAIRGETSLKEVSPLAEIVCYCLIPNHEHMILKQLVDNGISKFMHKLNGGYTMYFNKKYKRNGSLFQGVFKSAHIKSEEKLWQLSCYVNCNYEIHKLGKAENWTWSSYLDFIGRRQGQLINKKIILNEFKDIDEYIKYSKVVIKEAQQLKDEIRELILEET